MGEVRRYAPHRQWTKDEEDRLMELSEVMTKSQLAKELGRSVSSVNNKRISMGLASFSDQTDKLTITQIAGLVGVDVSTIAKTWRKYGMRFRTIGYFKMTTEQTLVAFMKKHPELWKASKCDYHFFCRYKWFIERLDKERTCIDSVSHYQNRRPWTSLEISRMQMLKRRGLTHREIGNELGRSKQAIDHMIMRCNEGR